MEKMLYFSDMCTGLIYDTTTEVYVLPCTCYYFWQQHYALPSSGTAWEVARIITKQLGHRHSAFSSTMIRS